MRQLCALFLCLLAAPAMAQDDGWNWSVTPYLWIASLDGSAESEETNPTSRSDTSSDYNFFALENLEAAGFITLKANRGKWTIQGDAMYLKFADQFEPLPDGSDLALRAWVFEVDALYKPERFDHLQFLAGVRSLEMNLKAQLAGNTLGVGSRQWVDPVVGAVYSRPISDRWFFTVRGDLGGFGISSDMTVNAFGVVGFNTSQNTSLLFGYRYTTYDFEEPDFTADLTAAGYLLAFQFRW